MLHSSDGFLDGELSSDKVESYLQQDIYSGIHGVLKDGVKRYVNNLQGYISYIGRLGLSKQKDDLVLGVIDYILYGTDGRQELGEYYRLYTNYMVLYDGGFTSSRLEDEKRVLESLGKTCRDISVRDYTLEGYNKPVHTDKEVELLLESVDRDLQQLVEQLPNMYKIYGAENGGNVPVNKLHQTIHYLQQKYFQKVREGVTCDSTLCYYENSLYYSDKIHNIFKNILTSCTGSDWEKELQQLYRSWLTGEQGSKYSGLHYAIYIYYVKGESELLQLELETLNK